MCRARLLVSGRGGRCFVTCGRYDCQAVGTACAHSPQPSRFLCSPISSMLLPSGKEHSNCHILTTRLYAKAVVLRA